MTEPEHDALSRRSLVKTAAAAAAVGGAMMIAGPAAAAETGTDTDTDAGEASAVSASAAASHEAATGDVVVHVRNAATGELDVYTPVGHRDVTDPALAARLIRLAR